MDKMWNARRRRRVCELERTLYIILVVTNNYRRTRSKFQDFITNGIQWFKQFVTMEGFSTATAWRLGVATSKSETNLGHIVPNGIFDVDSEEASYLLTNAHLTRLGTIYTLSL